MCGLYTADILWLRHSEFKAAYTWHPANPRVLLFYLSSVPRSNMDRHQI
jgi:hypothetical protein